MSWRSEIVNLQVFNCSIYLRLALVSGVNLKSLAVDSRAMNSDTWVSSSSLSSPSWQQDRTIWTQKKIRMVFPKMGGPNHPKICGFLLKPIKKNRVRQCWERHRQCMVDTTQIDIFTQILGVEYTRSMWWRDPTSCMKWLDLPTDCEWHQLLLWTSEVCLRQL